MFVSILCFSCCIYFLESGVSDGQMNHLFQYADGFRIRKQQSFLESGVSDGQITNCSNPIGMSTPMESKRFPILEKVVNPMG